MQGTLYTSEIGNMSGMDCAHVPLWITYVGDRCQQVPQEFQESPVVTWVVTVPLSGEGPAPVRLGSVSTGINPMRRGLASLEGPQSLLSQRSEWSLQGLTCEKKTKSILVKAANLYSKMKGDISGIEM